MPMKTTRMPSSSVRSREARHGAGPGSRPPRGCGPPPRRPVTQKAQSTAHPVWEERQTVKWPTGKSRSRVERREWRARDCTGVRELIDARRGLLDRHVDGLDQSAVGEAQAEFDAAVDGRFALRDFGQADRHLRRELSRSGRGELSHRREIEAGAAMKRVEDLASAISRKPPGLGEGFPGGGGGAERIHSGRVYSPARGEALAYSARIFAATSRLWSPGASPACGRGPCGWDRSPGTSGSGDP